MHLQLWVWDWSHCLLYQVISTIRTVMHPNWKPSDIQNGFDIAVLILKRPSRQQPIQLAPGDLPGFGAKLLAAGFGRGAGSALSPFLQQADNLDYIPTANCNLVEEYKGRIKENMLCAMDLDGKQDTCQGDSGGPLIVADKNGRAQFDRLVGIVSFGPTPCNTRDTPGVYTRVSAYEAWVQVTIKGQSGQPEILVPPAIQGTCTGLLGIAIKSFRSWLVCCSCACEKKHFWLCR